MAEGLKERALQINSYVAMLDVMCKTAKEFELQLTTFRQEVGLQLHPWSLPSLANAIGCLQATQSHLKAAAHHIETPEPPIDAEFEVVK